MFFRYSDCSNCFSTVAATGLGTSHSRHFGVTERLKHAGLPVEKAEGMWRDWAQKASP